MHCFVFIAASGFSEVLRHHIRLGIRDIGSTLIDGNNQTGVSLLDVRDPFWLKFAVRTWKQATELDVSVSGKLIIKNLTSI